MADRTRAERWQLLQEVLVASWELPGAERESYWIERVAGDDELLRELRELTAAREAAGAWCDDDVDDGLEPTREEPAERRMGPYVLDALIGRGGMGAVYAAHRADGEFVQRVALKVIGLPFELEPFRERFRRERQILAALSHPNIAHLLDGGTTEDGELYLAMEYVDGVPIDEYAKGRPLDERLRLFRLVCAGVQYAHQNLVVHRDIKPSNILVTAAGAPKLLDFGAAKLLADAEAAEATRLRMATAAYASPEQLRGESTSTLSDVFSLGALLFELATGRRAFDDDLFARAAGSAPLPERIAGDLGRVVNKAIALDPGERYSSVEQLAEDVRRYQSAEPVLAHAPALLYRAGKFARRHAWSLAAAATIALSLVGMTLYSVREAHRASLETDRARSTTRFLTGLFQLPFIDASSHHDMTVKELLTLAGERVAAVRGLDPVTATEADVVLGTGLDAQQDRAGAQHLLERALARAKDTGDVPRQAIATSCLALLAYENSDADRAVALAFDALALWRRRSADFDPEQAVEVIVQAGGVLQYTRPVEPEHIGYLEEAVRIGRRFPGQVATNIRAASLEALAESYLNGPGDSAGNIQRAYPLIQESITLDRSDPVLGSQLLGALRSWGRVNRFLGHYDQDESAQHEVYASMVKIAGPDEPATAFQRAVWSISLVNVGKTEEAYRESQAALADVRRVVAVPGSLQLWTNTASAAYAACFTRRFEACEALAREAVQTLGPTPQAGDLRVPEAHSYLGLALAGEGRTSESLPLLKETVEFYRSRNRHGPLQEALEAAYTKAQAGG